jgi:hypothetical protein
MSSSLPRVALSSTSPNPFDSTASSGGRELYRDAPAAASTKVHHNIMSDPRVFRGPALSSVSFVLPLR